MLEKEISRQKIVEALTPLVGEDRAKLCAEKIITMGYKKVKTGIWERDVNFPHKVKERYICSRCGRWTVVKKGNKETMLRAMRYCNGCGAQMIAVDYGTAVNDQIDGEGEVEL